MHLPEDVRRAVVQQAPGLIAAAPGLPTHPPTPGAGAVGNARRAAGDEAGRAFLERGLREVGGTVAELVLLALFGSTTPDVTDAVLVAGVPL